MPGFRAGRRRDQKNHRHGRKADRMIGVCVGSVSAWRSRFHSTSTTDSAISANSRVVKRSGNAHQGWFQVDRDAGAPGQHHKQHQAPGGWSSSNGLSSSGIRLLPTTAFRAGEPPARRLPHDQRYVDPGLAAQEQNPGRSEHVELAERIGPNCRANRSRPNNGAKALPVSPARFDRSAIREPTIIACRRKSRRSGRFLARSQA